MLLIIIWIAVVVIDKAKNQATLEAVEAKNKSIGSENKLKALTLDLETDIKQRKAIESALRESEGRLHLAIQGAELGIWDWDIKSAIMTYNSKWIEMMGYLKSDLDDSYAQWVELVHPEDVQIVEKALIELIDGYSSIFKSEHRVRKLNGEYIWILTNGTVMETDKDGKPIRVVGIQLDITDRKYTEQEFERLATIDPLTGVINRRRFFEYANEELQRVLRYKTPMSIAIFDFDHFKNVNDTFGHLTGDEVLLKISKLIENELRQVDLLARYGGEEFVILFPHTNQEEALATSERLRKILEDTPISTEAGEISVSISIGLSSVPSNTKITMDELLNQADKALYQSKRDGRNRVTVWNQSIT